MKITFSDNRKVFNWHDGNGAIPFLSFDMLDKLGVPHLYTTRYKNYHGEQGTDAIAEHGTIQENGFGEKGIRVAYMKGEDVTEARQVISVSMAALSEQLGSDLEHVCITNQQHTANVKLVHGADLGYWNSVERTEPIDGLVTNVPNACLAVYGADCPPVYIIDKTKHVIALVHAGWKGTLGKIPKVAVEMMVKEYGCNPADMYAAIGPSICESCYEMGDEVYDAFAERWSKDDADALLKRHPVIGMDGRIESAGKYHLDLWKANRMTLERCGIPGDHIETTNICTCCNSDEFYSYRAHKMENEQVAMLCNRF